MRKGFSIFMAAMLLAGILTVLPFGIQNAMGYTTPGSGVMWNFDDLVMFSGGAVTGGMSMYQVHETITVAPGDTLIVTPGLLIQMDPGMNIAIEVLGMLDANMGMGTLFHSFGPGTWRGIWVHDSGALFANGFMIFDAQNGIYIDHSMGFGMVQITGCTIDGAVNTGITMIGTMGGPMVANNIITGSPVGISLRDTSAQCMNNEVFNCGLGIRVEGFASPWLSWNQIHDNYLNGIYGEDTTFGISGNSIRENQGDAIALFNSTANINDNTIYAWNATAGSHQNGMNGIRINGYVEWGQNWISNNAIFGGNGDGSGHGGHAIYIDDFVGNMANQPQIENTVIENNFGLRGGNGGQNFEDWGNAGDGGCGVYAPRLPDDGDWTIDNHAMKITGNQIIAGGDGGFDNAALFGTAGSGGHGIHVADNNNYGSLLVSGNGIIQGGMGGFCSSPMGTAGIGGDGIRIENCGPGAREDIRYCPEIIGGMPGMGPAGMAQGGAGMHFEDSDNFHVRNASGRSTWTLSEINDSFGNFTQTNLSFSNSMANNGNLVRMTDSGSSGLSENWNFEGKNGLAGVILNNCSSLLLSGGNMRTSNATAMFIQNSGNISLRNLNINVTDGNGITMNGSKNVDLEDIDLGMNWTVPEKPQRGIDVNDSSNVTGGGLRMEWNSTVPGNYTPAFKWQYELDGCVDCKLVYSTIKGKVKVTNSQNTLIERTNITNNNGAALDAFNCNDQFVIDSFFDVTYNTTEINNTGMNMFNVTNAKVQNTTVKAKNATALNVLNGNGTFVIDSFFDVFFNTTGANNTGVDIFNSSGTEFNGCGIDVVNGNGLVVNDGPFLKLNLTSINVTGLGPILSGNFAFKQTNTHTPEKKTLEECNISATNADAVFVDQTDNFEIVSCNILAVNGSGVSASNGTGVWANKSKVNVPHPGYNGHGTRFKAIARGGCAGTTVAVGNGTGIEMWSSDWLYMKRVMVKATNATGLRIINSTRVNLDSVDIDGSNSTDPERPCEGIEGYGWEVGDVSGSNVTGFKGDGMNLTNCNNLSVFGNNIKNNTKTGIKLSGCEGMKIYHNNIGNNDIQASDDTGLNFWDNGYPSGGNYWSDYIGPDLMNGPLQNIPGPDGIGDIPYLNIQGGTGTADQYPLMKPWTPPPQPFFNITLNIGWNLISVPLEMDDTSIADVLSGISGKYDSVKAFDTLDIMDPWKSYRQNGTANDLSAIDNTFAVWVHATEACTLSVSGYIPTSTAIPLYAGWNLVGYPTMIPTAAIDALAGTGFDRLDCFDPASPFIREMLPPELMMPGCGYWVHVPADTIWTIDW